MADSGDGVVRTFAGRYQIERELGAGGMATVYLAVDLRHDRPVAIKVFNPTVTSALGGDRFLREIKTTAQLTHPHVLPLLDSGDEDGVLFYVMPFVDGETLRDRLNREKQLPVSEALRIGRDVADALSYAHDHGVVHRDIKPGNILLESGHAVVADFGIARAVDVAGGERLTTTGVMVGTPLYMSPEQAAGSKEVDGRSDVYSLGCVLFEMLAGHPPFAGRTVESVMQQHFRIAPPSVTAVRPTVPEWVDLVLAKALAKTPADRYSPTSTLTDALSKSLELDSGRPPDLSPARGKERRRMMWGVVGAGLAGLILGGLMGRQSWRTSPASPTTYDIGFPDSVPMSFTGGSPWGEGWPGFAVSNDGRFLVYVAERGASTELWYRSLTDDRARPLQGTAGAYHPMLEPNGDEVAYFSGDRLRAVPVNGGAPYSIGAIDRPVGGLWTPEGEILVADRVGSVLRSFSPTRRSVTDSLALGTCYQPFPLENGSEVLCSSSTTLEMRMVDQVTGEDRPLQWGALTSHEAGAAPLLGAHLQIVEPGYLLFVSVEGDLWAGEFDSSSGALGRGVRVLRKLRREGFSGAGQYAVTGEGTLVYAPGDNAGVGRFVRVRRNGEMEALPIQPGPFRRFDLSPDERRLAVVLQGLNEQELWVYDVRTGSGERWVTGFWIGEPRWHPSGERLFATVEARRGSPQEIAVSEPGSARLPGVLRLDGGFSVSQFLSDGKVLGVLADRYLGEHVAMGHAEGGALEVDSTFSTRTGAAVGWPTLSPTRRWLAYTSSETGRYDVVVEAFPDRGSRFRASFAGGLEPLWTGPTSLVFRNGYAWYEVQVDTAAMPALSEPTLLFRDSNFMDTPGRSQIAMRDGSVIYVQATGRSTGSYVRVVPRWTQQIRDLLRSIGP